MHYYVPHTERVTVACHAQWSAKVQKKKCFRIPWLNENVQLPTFFVVLPLSFNEAPTFKFISAGTAFFTPVRILTLFNVIAYWARNCGSSVGLADAD